jgi:hypothetical protein
MYFTSLGRVALASLLLTLACTTWVDADPACPRGQQRVDAHCVPTPSIVFQRCMEAFRTRSIEHDRGRELAVAASAEARGGSIQHERRDVERREYDGLTTDDLSVASGECRRQEEAERAGQIARAWEDAERARSDAETARLETVEAKSELRRQTAKLEKLEKLGERTREDEARRFADLPTIDEAAAEPAAAPDVDGEQPDDDEVYADAE